MAPLTTPMISAISKMSQQTIAGVFSAAYFFIRLCFSTLSHIQRLQKLSVILIVVKSLIYDSVPVLKMWVASSTPRLLNILHLCSFFFHSVCNRCFMICICLSYQHESLVYHTIKKLVTLCMFSQTGHHDG